jgi:hypothetical protein
VHAIGTYVSGQVGIIVDDQPGVIGSTNDQCILRQGFPVGVRLVLDPELNPVETSLTS